MSSFSEYQFLAKLHKFATCKSSLETKLIADMHCPPPPAPADIQAKLKYMY